VTAALRPVTASVPVRIRLVTPISSVLKAMNQVAVRTVHPSFLQPRRCDLNASSSQQSMIEQSCWLFSAPSTSGADAATIPRMSAKQSQVDRSRYIHFYNLEFRRGANDRAAFAQPYEYAPGQPLRQVPEPPPAPQACISEPNAWKA